MFAMFARRSDLPLERDAMVKFLPWLIAFMVYLAALALAGVMALNAIAARWDRGIGETLTVQMMPVRGAENTARVQAALDILESTIGVARADLLPAAQVAALLEPWLGGEGLEGLPLPLLINVELESGTKADVEALSKRLAAAIPGSIIDDHRVWLDRLVRFTQMVKVLAGIILTLIGLASVGTVIFTTRAGLSIHHEAIEVLHLIGAQDVYVARQFAGRALGLGFKGGVLGLVLAVPALLGLGYTADRLEVGLLPQFTFSLTHWVVLCALPIASALLSMVTAHYTVLRTLGRML